MKRIIIHFPFKIDRSRAAASQLRPIKMIEAFETLGYNVYLVEGYGKERKRLINNIKMEIKSGIKFDFIYSECNTTPTLLTEKHHFPIFPFLDFSFFKFCKNHGVKIGLFYRDIYWCFPEFNKGILSRFLKLFFKYDLCEYNKYVSVLFVPSFEMVRHIPYIFKMPVYELYPGCTPSKLENVHNTNSSKELNILYVGGIGRHYDIRLIMEVAKCMPSIHLTICCRIDEWEEVKKDYVCFLCDNIDIVHKSGKELLQLYANADLFSLFLRPDNYSEFGVPFKLFETIGYGCPIIASEGTWVAKYVKKNRIGFTCLHNKEALQLLLEQIIACQDKLVDAKTRLLNMISNNTWEARCREVEKVLNEK